MKTKLLLFLFLGLTLNSCFIGKPIESSKAKSEFTVENEAIRPEFGNEKDVVVIGILQGRKSYDKYLEKGLKRYGYNAQFNGLKSCINSFVDEDENTSQ